MKQIIIKYRKPILFIFLYIGLFRLGIELYSIITNNNIIFEYENFAGLIASFLFCLACFWELYISKREYKIDL